MGIQIAGAVSLPGITYDKVFLRRLTIDQHETTNDAPAPVYRVFVDYRLYGVIDGVRHFHPEIREIELADFVVAAWQQAGNGDNTLLVALPTIEAAIAKLIEGDMNTTAQVI